MATAWVQTGIRSGQATQSTTETAPSGAIGVDMEGVESVAVVLHAPTGQTFDGTGSMLGYRYLQGAWARAPNSDLDMSDFAGLTDVAPPALAVQAPTGRFIYVPSGVGLSSGTTVSTSYVANLRTGGSA